MKHARMGALMAAGAITVGALLSVATPAIGNAAFNQNSFDSCALAADKRYVRGETTAATLKDEYSFCCSRSGGYWNVKKSSCDAEPPPRTAEEQTPAAPRPTEASPLP